MILQDGVSHQNHVWKFFRIGLEKEVDEKKHQFVKAEQRLQEAQQLEQKVKDQVDALDTKTASETIMYLFQIIEEFETLNKQYGVSKSKRYKEARIPRYKRDVPVLKDLSVLKFIEMIEDRSILEFYLREQLRKERER